MQNAEVEGAVSRERQKAQREEKVLKDRLWTKRKTKDSLEVVANPKEASRWGIRLLIPAPQIIYSLASLRNKFQDCLKIDLQVTFCHRYS